MSELGWEMSDLRVACGYRKQTNTVYYIFNVLWGESSQTELDLDSAKINTS